MLAVTGFGRFLASDVRVMSRKPLPGCHGVRYGLLRTEITEGDL